MESGGRKLRTGFTTGTCAAAGARAGMLAIAGRRKVGSVPVLLPGGRTVEIPVAGCEFGQNTARCTVVKDGGDDPDVTHGAEIVTELELGGPAGRVEILGGEGVGTVTKPGLGLEIGGPAINPVPRRMIEENLAEAGREALRRTGARVTVSVPRGRGLAPKTDNPRLGIVGGISILGTSGIVVPYSTASFAAAIRQNLDVAAAMGDRRVVLTTGGRSEELARGIIDLPDHCFVQMGDFAGYAMRQCARRGMERAYVVGFIGKLSKMAAGAGQTHVKGSKVDTRLLAAIAEEAGEPAGAVRRIREANTARHALEIAAEGGGGAAFCGAVCARVAEKMGGHAGGRVPVEVVLLGFDGKALAWHRPQ